MRNLGELFPSLELWRSFVSPSQMSSHVAGDEKQRAVSALLRHACSSPSSTWKKDPNPWVSYSTPFRSKSQPISPPSLPLSSLRVFSPQVRVPFPASDLLFLVRGAASRLGMPALPGDSTFRERGQGMGRATRSWQPCPLSGSQTAHLWHAEGDRWWPSVLAASKLGEPCSFSVLDGFTPLSLAPHAPAALSVPPLLSTCPSLCFLAPVPFPSWCVPQGSSDNDCMCPSFGYSCIPPLAKFMAHAEDTTDTPIWIRIQLHGEEKNKLRELLRGRCTLP